MKAWVQPLSVLALVIAGFASCNAVKAETPLVQHLREGGYVLLMRHAHAPAEPPAGGMTAPDNLNHERQLDETGRGTARAMGDAIRKLHIRVGAVLSSPAYRALQTIWPTTMPMPLRWRVKRWRA